MVIVHSYVKLPEGKMGIQQIWSNEMFGAEWLVPKLDG